MDLGNWDLLEVVKVGISALAVISIGMAIATYKANQKKQEEDRKRAADKEYVDQATNSFKWAYDALTDEGKHIPPRANRLNWLTAARHILAAEEISALIDGDVARKILEEREEFWRHKIYLALHTKKVTPPSYFEGDNDGPIAPDSAATLIRFSNWKESREDRLDDVDIAEILSGPGFVGGIGRALRTHIEIPNERIDALMASAIPLTPLQRKGDPVLNFTIYTFSPEFMQVLDEYGIEWTAQKSIGIQAGPRTVVVSISRGAITALAAVCIAYINRHSNAEVVVTHNDNTIIQIKGMSADEVAKVLESAKSFIVKPDTPKK